MSEPGPPGRRRLTVTERTSLAWYADMVRRAPSEDARDIAIAAAAAAARRCRASAADWEEIAEAFAVDVTQLRQWLADTAPKPSTAASSPVAFSSTAGQQTPGTAGFMAAVGNAIVNGNDFAREIAAIRSALAPLQDAVIIERFNAEIAEIRIELSRHRPTVLHIAAHGRTDRVAIGWHGTLTDEQARIFARQLYSRLSTGANVQDCFDPRHLTVAAAC